MIKGVKDYQTWKQAKLADPAFAADYLNEAAKASPATLLRAIKNVAQAREIASVAKEAGIARENLHRAFSEQGNPTYDTLTSVLNALGLRLGFSTAIELLPPAPSGRVPLGIGASAQSNRDLGQEEVSGAHNAAGPYLAYVNPNPVQTYAGSAGRLITALEGTNNGRNYSA